MAQALWDHLLPPEVGTKNTKTSIHMKTLLPSIVALSVFSTGLVNISLAKPTSNPLVNAYGEPAGFGNLPDVLVTDAPVLKWSNTLPGMTGMYVWNRYVDVRNFESIGMRQTRLAEEANGTVTIGPLEVIGSGPTGPMTPEAQTVATDEVTAQVLARIKATDRLMTSLDRRSKDLDDAGRARFTTAAAEVQERRQALRESLKAVRAASDDQWSSARSAVADNFNAYVQSTHRAAGVVSTTGNS